LVIASASTVIGSAGERVGPGVSLAVASGTADVSGSLQAPVVASAATRTAASRLADATGFDLIAPSECQGYHAVGGDAQPGTCSFTDRFFGAWTTIKRHRFG
jgi:hypothetical protein